jgi:hypothetical protein
MPKSWDGPANAGGLQQLQGGMASPLVLQGFEGEKMDS